MAVTSHSAHIHHQFSPGFCHDPAEQLAICCWLSASALLKAANTIDHGPSIE